MSDFRLYRKRGLTEITPWHPGYAMADVSISKVDADNGSPKSGDVIARNPNNLADRWLIAEAFFLKNYEAI